MQTLLKTLQRTGMFLIGALALAGVLLLSNPTGAAAAQAQGGVVQGVMFWEKGCPNCERVMADTLPALQTRYDGKFKLDLVEVSSVDDVDHLYQVGAAYGLQKSEIGVPLLILGDQVLVGAVQIPAELPGLIDRYLAAGGVQTTVRTAASAAPAALPAAAAQNNGMWLAWVTVVGLGLALVIGLWQLILALQGGQTFQLPGWTNWLVPLLAVAGSFVAIYLTFIETTKAKAICGPIGDCNAVQNSPYALLFGLVQVGLVGLLGYIAILAAWLWRRIRQDVVADYVPVALLGMSMFGVIFSAYLTYLEIYVIHAVCIWCISSAWIMILLMLISLPAASSWLAGSGESEVEAEEAE